MMMLVLVLTLLLCVTILYKYIQLKVKYKELEKLPGPKPYPIIGNVLEFGSNPVEVYRNFHRLSKLYGPLFVYWLPFGQPVLCVSGEKYMEYFLSSTEHLEKSPMYKLLGLWLGDGLICGSGDKWRKHRKCITPAFHFKILESFVPTLSSSLEKLLEKLEERNGETYDVYPTICANALDSICESVMGVRLNSLEKGDVPYGDTIRKFMSLNVKRNFSILQKFDAVAKLTGVYYRQLSEVEKGQRFVAQVIEERIERRNMEVRNVGDGFEGRRKIAFLDLMLELHEEGKLSMKDLQEEVDNFMLAGFDTTSVTVAVFLHEIAQHPDIQEDIFEEIRSHGLLVGVPTYADLANLKYLEAAIKESLRKTPTVPFVERILAKDVELGGFKIPATTIVNLHIHGLHRSEELYPDSQRFDPSRFFAEECQNRHPYAYVPFSAGPRNCIGQKFAMLSLKLTFLKILANFRVRPAPNFEIVFGNNGVLQPEEVVLKLEKR